MMGRRASYWKKRGREATKFRGNSDDYAQGVDSRRQNMMLILRLGGYRGIFRGVGASDRSAINHHANGGSTCGEFGEFEALEGNST